MIDSAAARAWGRGITHLAAEYDPQRSWWGAPQTGLSHEFERIENDHGFLIECGHASTGSTGSAVPWESGEQHKELMSQGRFAAAFVFLIRDRGHGRVTIDGDGNSVHTYPFVDAQDQRLFRRGLAELSRLHQAAGAHEIYTLHRRLHRWRRGEDSTPSSRVCRRRRCRHMSTRPSPPTRWARRGWAAIPRRASPHRPASCTTSRVCGSAMPARSRRPRGRIPWGP